MAYLEDVATEETPETPVEGEEEGGEEDTEEGE